MKTPTISIFIFLYVSCVSALQAQKVKDIDGNEYSTITIGTQTWMKENLKVTHYNNGDAIATTISDTMNICLEDAPKYQWAYEGKESNVAVFGRLYTWYAATDNRNVCPAGWHVPDKKDWVVLFDYLGGTAIAPNKIREAGNEHWANADTVKYNESGFTALPSGKRTCNGMYLYLGKYCSWQSSTDSYASSGSNIMHLTFHNFGQPLKSYNDDKHGVAVRCLKNM